MAGPDAASDAPEPRVRSRAEHAKTRIERVAMRFSLPTIERGHHGQSAGSTENEEINDKEQE